ncbi:MAG TPA: protein kinase [Candidatus Binatia bacterium]|nr:protein kinase [Candidatus Binatia bacterium]
MMDDHRRLRFGRYEILGELGRGAMGVVYKARDPKINRVVAVKTVSLAGQSPDDEREYRERFVREAEAAGRLSHPGIVTIYDVGEEPDTRSPYIVMEYVSGPSLEKMISGSCQTLAVDTALQLALELAEALDCAHGQGVIHRDLKPSNILMTQDGRAKIADFGIAKLNLANITLSGRTLGTPAYMSPEQVSGEPVDSRADLFSLGVILYTVLTGYRPFQGNSAMTVSFKVVNRDPIPASVLDTELPPGVDYIISRAMAKDPAQRYQRGMEIVLDIQEFREGREPWSKNKQPVPLVAVNSAETTNARIRTRAAGMQRPPAGHNPFLQPDLPEKLLKILRKNSYLSAAVLLAGLAVVALGMGHSLRSQKAIAGIPPAATPAIPSQPLAANPAVQTSAQPAVATAIPAPIAPVHKKTKISGATAKNAAPPPASTAVDMSTLEIEVNHKFPQANLSIWVDNRLTYTHALEGSDKQRLVVFHHVQGHEFHAVEIPAGNHQLKVHVTSDVNSYDQFGTIKGDFPSGKEALLHINFGKQGEMQLSLQ